MQSMPAVCEPSGAPALASERELRLLERFARVARHLQACKEVGELLAGAAEVSRQELGFSRGLVLDVSGGQLSACDSGPLSDSPSDRLRRRLLAAPVPVLPGTAEDTALRNTRHSAPMTRLPSPLADALELEAYLLAPIMIEGRPIGLLVLDRQEPDVQAVECALAAHLATVVGLLLERLLLAARVSDVAAELRRLTTFSHALMRESEEAPLELPSKRSASVVRLPGAVADTASCRPNVPHDYKLTGQELRVLRLVAAGWSNRQIAAELVVSMDTVKSHVGHVLQKLGVANRAQAAVLFASGEADRSAV